MKLYLAQHGDAVPKEQDPDRPLSEVGRRDVTRMGIWLAAAGVRTQQVFNSGKTRARESAETLARAMLCADAPQMLAGIAPNDPVIPIARALAQWDRDTLLVGHQPFLGRLVSLLLTGKESPAIVSFTPGSVVCLQRESEAAWVLAWMLRPELLSAVD